MGASTGSDRSPPKTHEAKAGHYRVATLLQSSEDAIVAHWMKLVADAVASRSLDPKTLEDSVRKFLKHLRGRLKHGTLRQSGSASQHGEQRHTIGFHVSAVVREYGLLLESIEAVAVKEGIELTMSEYGSLTRHVLAGLAEASTAFLEQQQRTVQDQAHRHFAFIAHELRNPLQNMGLALEAWKIGQSDGHVREILERALKVARDLTDKSLIEAQNRQGAALPTPHCSDFDLIALIDDVLTTSALHSATRSIRLNRESNEELPVHLDERLVRSVLTNLVRNGIKFSHRDGMVCVRARESAEGRVHIEVEDRCGGLDEGVAQQMFVPFAQMGTDRSGFGLGLAITRQAVEAHGGNVQVLDVPQGCTFVVDLPTRYTK